MSFQETMPIIAKVMFFPKFLRVFHWSYLYGLLLIWDRNNKMSTLDPRFLSWINNNLLLF